MLVAILGKAQLFNDLAQLLNSVIVVFVIYKSDLSIRYIALPTECQPMHLVYLLPL